MPSYCDTDGSAKHLPPSSIGSGTGQITSANATANIVAASAIIDAALPNYWQFPAYGSTPDTPAMVVDLAEMLSAALDLEELGMANYGAPEGSYSMSLRDRVDKLLAMLQTGQMQIEHVQISNEAIDWEENDPIDTGTHDFAFGSVNADQPYRVIDSSVTITDNNNDPATGYELGIDYDVRRVLRYNNKWWLVRLDSAITEAVDTVSYRFTYEKGDVEQTAPRSGQFWCGRG